MKESTDLQTFSRKMDGWKVTVKICLFVLFYRETNSKFGKIYFLATMKYTWCAYLPLLAFINKG